VSIGLIDFRVGVIVTIRHYYRGIAMQNFDRPIYAPYARSMDMSVDQGLRSFMLGVFNYMALGVALTGLAAYLSLVWLSQAMPRRRRRASARTPISPNSVAWSSSARSNGY